MSRALTYPRPPGVAVAAAAADQSPDGFKEKLLKYIPGEVVAFFVAVTALAGSDEEGILWFALVAGTIASPIYLRMASGDVPAAQRPKWWSYALTVVSFVIWAFATSAPTADLLGISEKLAGVILAAAVLFIPAVDSLATSGS